ncbi:MAG TPA: universal stress protein, partial [Blastocatellia bacterium]|nr:universal stress protein [Blastocatellia bacterium]
MNILLAIHHTPSPETIVDHVASLPWPAGCVARVVTVVEPAADGAQSATDGAQAGTHAAELLVEAAAARLRDAGLEASGAVLEGSPKTDIVEYAGYWRASLVLAGSHARHEPARRLFLGSIAQSIVRNAPCSVEIVRPPLSPRG